MLISSVARISKRTIQKTRNPKEKGHDTAALRLIWESGEGRILVRCRGNVVHECDASWIRNVSVEGLPIERVIVEAWREYRNSLLQSFGLEAECSVQYLGGGFCIVAALNRRHRNFSGNECDREDPMVLHAHLFQCDDQTVVV